jgi:hypothetical protein
MLFQFERNKRYSSTYLNTYNKHRDNPADVDLNVRRYKLNRQNNASKSMTLFDVAQEEIEAEQHRLLAWKKRKEKANIGKRYRDYLAKIFNEVEQDEIRKGNIKKKRSKTEQELLEKKVFSQALNYKFNLKDIGKYSKRLSYKDINWIMNKRKGPRIRGTDELTEDQVRQLRSQKKFDEEMEKALSDFRRTDWAKTPVYSQFLDKGRWVNSNQDIYSEIEVKYL